MKLRSAALVTIRITVNKATYLKQRQINHIAFIGPWRANNIAECDGLTSMMSCQAFPESSPNAASRIRAYRVFEPLHKMGDRRIPTASHDALVLNSRTAPQKPRN